MKLKFSLLPGLAGLLSCALAVPVHAETHSGKGQQPTVVATAATATPALLTRSNVPGARVPGTENGYPDVNPVFALKAGHMVCGNHHLPLDVKVEDANDQAVLLTWNKKRYVLNRIPTSTGAYHFDDVKAGVVLIQIPTKSMLFDKKNMTRLADDCVPTH